MADFKRPKDRRKALKPLTDTEIVTGTAAGRRHVLTMVGVSVVGATAVTGWATSSSGNGAPGSGAGRNGGWLPFCGNSGAYDSDTGQHADPVSGCRRRKARTFDADAGQSADPRPEAIDDPADSDLGRYADPTDSD